MIPSVDLQPPDSDREHDGRAMSALTDRKRHFVLMMLQQGVNPKAALSAAKAAGFTAEYSYKLMRDPNILAALREEAGKRLTGAALMGVNVMLQIANDPTHKDQFRAAKELAAINGFTAEQKIVVEHINQDSKELLTRVRQMAVELGMDPRQLIASAGIIDAEYEVIQPALAAPTPTVDDSDW